jgi:glycosyltransferase involved in cell wall biosynthesis
MNIYYYLPENDRPSWGAGVIYYHTWLLQKNNFAAHVLYDKKPYRLKWLKLDVSFKYLDDAGLKIQKNDILVIPEVCVNLPSLRMLDCKKIVFVQNAFYIYQGLSTIKNYEEAGIEQVFYIMPHLKKILGMVTVLPLYETIPFVAPYYFKDKINHARKRRIILYPKFDNKEYVILKRMLEDKLGLRQKRTIEKLFASKNDWEIIELKDKTHHEVAEEMGQAAFFISLNTTEAFNTSVPEAMAAGCINICYEGVGPADFLEDKVNAFVFSNNHIYPMVEKIIELVERYDTIQPQLQLIRTNARSTADNYTLEKLETQLIPFFKDWGR